MRIMKEKNIPAVPTFTVFDHFAQASPAVQSAKGR